MNASRDRMFADFRRIRRWAAGISFGASSRCKDQRRGVSRSGDQAAASEIALAFALGWHMVNSPQHVEIKILDERIREWGLPRYHSEEAAGLDLFACVDAPLVVMPQAPAVLIPAGVAIHIGDPGVTAIIVPRSGLGHKGLVMGNLVGVVDADYLGPIVVSVWNRNGLDAEPMVITPGDRIAQMLFVPVIRVEFAVVADFARSSRRGTGGFGSTGESHASVDG